MLPADATVSPRAYLLRLKLSPPDEAAALARELEERGATVEREGAILTTLWRASDADNVDGWSEHGFMELVFFLRSWTALRGDRDVLVLEDHPVGA